jgi:Uma2 family endonuclease
LLHDVRWQTYEALLEDIGDRPIRLTYHRGDLEIMTLSHGHENYNTLLGRFIETLTEELNIPIHSGGSTTMKKETLQSGLESDECYWIRNEPAMRGKKEFDILKDPPPDLAVEVDITSSPSARMDIYASLRIPEVWRFDGENLRVFVLDAKGRYQQRAVSAVFPFLPLEKIADFIRLSDTQDETTLIRSFRQWVREEILPVVNSGKKSPTQKRKPRNK